MNVRRLLGLFLIISAVGIFFIKERINREENTSGAPFWLLLLSAGVIVAADIYGIIRVLL